MKIYKINEYEKVVSEDLNDLQKSIHQSLYDKILYPFLQRQDGFLGDSFTPSRGTSSTVIVKAGRGFMWDATQIGVEPKYRAIELTADLTLTVGAGTWAAAPVTNGRIDIIVVRPKVETTLTSQRYIKTNGTGPIALQTVDKVVEQLYEINVVEGTEDVTPVAPATPAGWVKIANVTLAPAGIASGNDVVDTREVLLPSVQALQSETRYVSPSGSGTDTTLASAIGNLPSGGSIMILEDISIAATHTLPANTLLKGRSRATTITVAAGGKLVLGNNCKIENMKITTAETNLNPMVEVDGNDSEISSVLFDLPVGGTNLGVKIDGTGFEINSSNFTNSDESGTNTSISILGDTTKSFGRASLQGTIRDLETVSATYAVKHSDLGKTLLVNSAAGAFDLDLPAPYKGFRFFVKDIGGLLSTYGVTLDRNGAESIEGLAADYILEANYGIWEIFTDGTNWFVA